MEASAIAVLVPFFAVFSFFPPSDQIPPLTRVGSFVLGAACVYIAYRLRRDGSARRPVETQLSAEEYAAAHRRTLLAQAKLFRTAPRWYVGPMVPGFVLFYGGFVYAAWNQGAGLGNIAGPLAGSVVGTALFLVFVWWLNVRMSQRLGRSADSLVSGDGSHAGGSPHPHGH